MTIAAATNMAQAIIARPAAPMDLPTCNGVGNSWQEPRHHCEAGHHLTIAKIGGMFMRQNPTICGPRDRVHTVFPHRMRAANTTAIVEEQNRHTLSRVTRFGSARLCSLPAFSFVRKSLMKSISPLENYWRESDHPSAIVSCSVFTDNLQSILRGLWGCIAPDTKGAIVARPTEHQLRFHS